MTEVELNPDQNLPQTLLFQASHSGSRLDQFLAQAHPEISRSRWQALIEQGQIQINGQVCLSKKIPIQIGDLIGVEFPPPQACELVPEAIPLDVLYEDDQIILINKPVGLVVHPAPGHDSGTLVHALLAHCPDLPGIGGQQRPGIVHRLDKDTSGVMMVAKTEFALQHLQAQIKARTAKRDYLGLVQGVPPTPTGTINAAIGRHPSNRKKMAVTELERGRGAITHWSVQERLGHYTLVLFQLDTGRTHQIRVHAAHAGWPITGDPVYGTTRKVAGHSLSGQMLHAYQLTLNHPLTNQQLTLTAPLPPPFAHLLQALRRQT
ncbi:RluA family pseudouridine synthase [Thermosynechococcaceae cyanobacterium BACA0444]|uniref:Pseudouridine synthase n=1 Tax=Pseudocalidococcus azoricus BACA0444 TaxID=2918990 RepID=A0AAE4FVF7_9CYAN|nr:RluA family pseudouridine synthase [Pseudocalidococcus azoricus]MDS3862044.1 RluA family pseudouridine synthase [Pseudocalidococcus azoricus BACA0444]